MTHCNYDDVDDYIKEQEDAEDKWTAIKLSEWKDRC